MSRYLPSIIAAVVAASAAVSDVVSGAIAANPEVAMILAGLSAVLANFVPSPLKPRE